MKYILTIVAMCLSMMGAEKKETDLDRDGYNGSIKSVVNTQFKITEKFGKSVTDKFSITISKYDEEGGKLEKVDYNILGNPVQKYTYNHGNTGNTAEETTYNASGKLTRKSIYKYRKNGKLMEQFEYKANGKPTCKWVYKHDLKGNCIECLYYDSDGDVILGTTDKYGGNGKQLENIQRNDKGPY